VLESAAIVPAGVAAPVILEEAGEVAALQDAVRDSDRAHGVIGEEDAVAEQREILGLDPIPLVDRADDVAGDRS
jgi:hypothetical protein